MTFSRHEEPSYWADIYVAGDAASARRICREHCMAVGLCVTVTETDFIYTGGAESGVKVGLVNYPRFPASKESVFSKAEILAEKLAIGLCQWSALIVAPDRTLWLTNKPTLTP